MTRTTQELLEAGDRHGSSTFSPARMILDHGEGVWIYDRDGNKYLDFVAGIAVTSLGYNHPRLTAALRDQVERLMHVSNLYYSAEQIELVDTLCARSFADRVFLCNSGTEAVESAIKLARRYQNVVVGKPEKYGIVSMLKSFHGRTMGALAATGQPKYHAGFEPMLPGFDYAEYNNLEDVASKVGPNTAAVLIEPIQGEGGVNPADAEFLRGLRKLCDDNGALLIFDEIQTGVGRTGKFFAHEAADVRPDIVTLAKGLGGGVPIGAMLSTEEIFQAFVKGSHGTTFGGNPLAARAALTVLEVLDEEELMANAAARGEQLREGLEALAERYDVIQSVRGRGLMMGAICGDAAPAIVGECLKQGLLINTAGGNTLRFVPPMIVTEDDVKEALKRLGKALEVFANS